MTGPERGFLLLCSHLGDPERKCLSTAQFRNLTLRMHQHSAPGEDRDLTVQDLRALGYGAQEAQRIVHLLSEELRLERYLKQGEKRDCYPLTPFSRQYPRVLEKRLGMDAPGVLWYKGNPQLLAAPAVALVGSRDLLPRNREFAAEAGAQAARQGFVLVSGNARGADRTAQDACLDAGGRVISFLADAPERYPQTLRTLLISEDSFDLGFSALRALSRNRLIHSMGIATLVAQSSLKTGGTWDGSVKNLRFGWTNLYCFDDGRDSTRLLEQMGASVIGMEALKDLRDLPAPVSPLI